VIHLFTDFGLEGPYLGEMEAVLRRAAPEVPVVNLMADAPAFSPRPAAYLLAALAERLEPGDVLLGVVDPGVGSERLPVAVEADGRWFVGPDNRLFELVARRAGQLRTFAIAWRPARLSASFHGRDLFAPTAARLARGGTDGLEPAPLTRFPDWPDDVAEIVYVDRYGNAMTGLRAATLPPGAVLLAAGRRLPTAGTAFLSVRDEDKEAVVPVAQALAALDAAAAAALVYLVATGQATREPLADDSLWRLAP
jgi:S-adenosylmethionine hydrolase